MSNREALNLLTRAEIDVIYAYCEYETIKETSRFLQRSQQTVKNHLSSIYRKLGVNKGHAAVYRLGIHAWLDVPEINISTQTDEAVLAQVFATISSAPPTQTFPKG